MYTNIYLLILLPIVLSGVHYYFYYTSFYHSHYYSYPTLNSVYEIYEQFKEGDIVFSKEYKVIDQFTQYINNGVAHTGCIGVENGIKYHFNAVPHTNHPKHYIIKTYEYMGFTWSIVKEPLLDYILKYKCIYYIYRHPKIHASINFSQLVLPNRLTYCSQIIGDMLFKDHLIESAYYVVTPYTTDDLINLLLKRGYKYFFFKQV
jgi:hypothetical protein